MVSNRVHLGRAKTLLVMALTAAVILTVSYLANRPAAGGGLTLAGLSTGAAGPAPEVGKPAPNFTATTLEGAKVTLQRPPRPPGLADLRGPLVPAVPSGEPGHRGRLREVPRAGPEGSVGCHQRQQVGHRKLCEADRPHVSEDRRLQRRDRIPLPDRRHPLSLLHRQLRDPARDQDLRLSTRR